MRMVGLLLAAGALVLGGAPRAAPAFDLIRLGRAPMAGDFEVPTLGGAPLRLSALRGQIVLVNFWATWCEPCKDEMPAMERLYRRLRDRGLVVVAVSVDAQTARVSPFVRRGGFTFRVGLDSRMSVANRYTVRALPSTFLIDREGRLVSLALGPREWDGPAAAAEFEAMLGRPGLR